MAKNPVNPNIKAEKFEAYLKQRNLTFFVRDPVPNDNNGTVIYKTNLEAEGQTLPVGIIIDSTLYSVIRVQVGTRLINPGNQASFMLFLNELNRSYKVFKYVATDDGTLFLDACLPSTAESFEPHVVHVVLDVMANHLKDEYKTLMRKAWE